MKTHAMIQPKATKMFAMRTYGWPTWGAHRMKQIFAGLFLGTLLGAIPNTWAGKPELPVDLGSAGDFAILAGTAISTVPSSAITGDIGTSPAVTHTAITGFGALPMDLSGTFSTSPQVSGNIYAFDYANPTPPKMVTATADMLTAYTTAAGRTIPDTINFGATAGSDRDLGGFTMYPGLHKWSTGVLISTDLMLDAEGDPDAVFIFQISGDLTIASYQKVLLSGGAQARNIFWQVAGGAGAIIDTYAHFEGVVMTAKAIVVRTGASFNGKLLAQSAVTLDQNNIMDSDLIPPPTVTLTIISEHGIGNPLAGLPPEGIVYTNIYGSTLSNSISAVELSGSTTQYVNTGWSMIGNDPLAGTTNAMSMVHTNDAVLTWLWSTNYMFDASAQGNGTVAGSTNGFYAAGEIVTVTATAGLGAIFIGWSGDVSGATNNAAQTMTMDKARTVVAHFSTDQVTLEIISEHGIGLLPVGIYSHTYGTSLTNTITSMETLGGTQYVNTGWSMIGNDPVAGTNNVMSMVHTNDAVLTWLWSTNYMFNASAQGNGTVAGSTNGFYAAGEIVTVTATAGLGAIFTGWSGDVSGPTNNAAQTMTMDQARTVVAHFATRQVMLEIISEHGIGVLPAGVYSHAYGTILTNTITDMETLGGTQYVNTGWSMIGNDPVAGTTNAMSMVHTNDAVLTWLWSTNYYLSLVSTHGSIASEEPGWKPAGQSFDLYPTPDFGYAFDHWEMNGVNEGVGVPLPVTMDQAKEVTAYFTPIFVDVSADVDWSVVWKFDPRKGYFLGTLKITNTHSRKVLLAPFWFEVESTDWHWLRSPDGLDANTGYHYVDISSSVASQLSGIGNNDQALDVGESVTVTGIQLMGRRTPTGLLMAVWADPPGTLAIAIDTDGDGVSDADEAIAGTSASDPESFFRIRLSADKRSVLWDTRPNRTYTILTSTNLAQGFTAMPNTIDGTGATALYSVQPQAMGDAPKGAVFYKVKVHISK